MSYIQGFSSEVRRIFEYFEFETEIEKMRVANILYLVVSQFRTVDLHPKQVPNNQMGLIFENLIRRFNELANETAGDHFTPREVIRLMVNVLFIHDDELLATPGTVRKLLDPACGTGGMHGAARLFVYGQDYNRRAFATAASDMLMKQVDHNGGGDNIRFGDSLIEDRFEGERFDYFLTNPPFGVDWKRQQKDPDAEPVLKGRGKDDFENVPLGDDVDDYFEREVRPHVPDAWMDRSKDRVGYEISFNRHFYRYTPPRPLEATDAELKRACTAYAHAPIGPVAARQVFFTV